MAPPAELPELTSFLEEVEFISEDPRQQGPNVVATPPRSFHRKVAVFAVVALLGLVVISTRGPSTPTRSDSTGEAIQEFAAGLRGPPRPPKKKREREVSRNGQEADEEERRPRGPGPKPFPKPSPRGSDGKARKWMSPAELREYRRQQMVENLKKQATLRRARRQYDEESARAFASLAKITYCGPLPGIYAAVASTCSRLNLPGAESVCEAGNFSVVPGFVRTMRANDANTTDAVFGIVAKVQADGDNAKVKNGVLISIRGSIDDYQNSVRDKEVTLVSGLEDCDGCKVHQGYHETYHMIEKQLDWYLQELQCHSEDCRIYVTGHGSGAAVASLAAWELVRRNYTIGTSYLFETPMVGDAKFAHEMTEMFDGHLDHGPIFSITHGKDSVPRWPFDKQFKAWGVEAYYPTVESLKVQQFCLAGDKSCGLGKYKQEELTSKDTCANPLAPDSNFCEFRAFSGQCYGGLGFNIIEHWFAMVAEWKKQMYGDQEQSAADGAETSEGAEAYDPLSGEQPNDEAASKWHPSVADGEQIKALKESKSPKDFYNIDTLRAMATLSKISYCGNTLAVSNVVQSSCNGHNGPCSKAGFGVVPHTVVPVGVEYQSEKTNPQYVRDTLFFYTALIRRTDRSFAKAPYFMPAESCVLVFRGSANEQNNQMNTEIQQVPLNDTACEGCTASKGIYQAWKNALEAKVIDALKRSGCEADSHLETSKKVFITGHSMGGTMTTLAAYMLHKQGFAVQLSWALESGRPGNPALMDYISNDMLSSTRSVPLWQVTNKNDYVTRSPASNYAAKPQGVGRHQYQVHFGDDSKDPELCTSEEDVERGTSCGIYKYDRKKLSSWNLPNDAHCKLPYMPGDGQICMLGGYPLGSPYAEAVQCTFGGSIV